MDENLSGNDQDGQSGEVLESVGMPADGSEETKESNEGSNQHDNDPVYVQKRLKQQKRAHDRELREMQARIADLQSRVPSQSMPSQSINPYTQNTGQPGSVEETIHKAVSFALGQKDMEERRAKEAQDAAHIQSKYRELHNHLDKMGDKYDDFHDVVLGDNAKFSNTMRDYAMTMPKSGSGSAGEVLYKLGQNPQELERIANLHPMDQVTEMQKLSHALISGGSNEMKSAPSKTLGQIKSAPISNSHAVTEKTPIENIRQRMKSGNWK